MHHHDAQTSFVIPLVKDVERSTGCARIDLVALPPASGLRLWRPDRWSTISNSGADSRSRVGSMDDFRERGTATRQQSDS